jgi:hypothetical protein
VLHLTYQNKTITMNKFIDSLAPFVFGMAVTVICVTLCPSIIGLHYLSRTKLEPTMRVIKGDTIYIYEIK